MTKLVLGILSSRDADQVTEALVAAEYRATRVNTAGGFLSRGNATLLVGVSEHQVNDVVSIFRANAGGESEGSADEGTGVVFVLPALSITRT